MDEIRQSIERLCKCWGDNPTKVGTNHIFNIWKAFKELNFSLGNGKPPEPYDEAYSEICWGWLNVGDPSFPIVATYGNGECGNHPYNYGDQGLVIYIQSGNEDYKRILDIINKEKKNG